MSKKRKVVVPDFSSHKKQTDRNPLKSAIAQPPVAPKPPAIKPQATSSKSGHRGQ
jgi:hypothetical protein